MRRCARTARIHWPGCTRLGAGPSGSRPDGGLQSRVVPLSKTRDAEVRAQAARSLGDGARRADHFIPLAARTRDRDPRVRFFAALAWPKGGGIARRHVPFRGGGRLSCMAKTTPTATLPAPRRRDWPWRPQLGEHEAMAAARTSRRQSGWPRCSPCGSQHAPEVAPLLADPDPHIAHRGGPGHPRRADPRRPAAAGGAARPAEPARVPAVARPQRQFPPGRARKTPRPWPASRPAPAAPEKLRVEAVKMLGGWAKPGRRDRVTGLTQDLRRRDPAHRGREALRASLGGIFSGPDAVRGEAAKVAAALGIKEVGPAAASTWPRTPSAPPPSASRCCGAGRPARIRALRARRPSWPWTTPSRASAPRGGAAGQSQTRRGASPRSARRWRTAPWSRSSRRWPCWAS